MKSAVASANEDDEAFPHAVWPVKLLSSAAAGEQEGMDPIGVVSEGTGDPISKVSFGF